MHGRVKGKGWLASSCITLPPPPFGPLGLHWSPDSPGTLATDWSLLESRTRKTITSPLFHSLQSIMEYYHSIGVCVAVYCVRQQHFPNGLNSVVVVLLPFLPLASNNGSPQILWILRKKFWILHFYIVNLPFLPRHSNLSLIGFLDRFATQPFKSQRIFGKCFSKNSNWSERIRRKSLLRT